MSTDGGLRQLEMKHIKECHWQSIETWSTGQGVPDMNGCIDGVEFWIENKMTKGFAVVISPHQISWIERRVRNGGRVFIAVRRLQTPGARREACDELHLFDGRDVRRVAFDGVQPATAPWARLISRDGPARWDWAAFRAILAGK